MRWLFASLALLATGAAGVSPIGDGMGGDGVDTPIPLPSGHDVTLHEVIPADTGSAGLTVRFRFLAPWIAEAPEFGKVAGDMAYLCESYALPRIADIGPQPAQIVISLADKPVDFGQISPDTVQFFEAFRPDDGACVWELF